MKKYKKMLLSVESTYQNYPSVTLFATLSSAYLIYYVLKIAHRPRLYCSNTFRQFLTTHMSMLEETYKPTFWSFGAIAQTLLRSLIKSHPPIKYRREFLTLSDGGHVSLDWLDNDQSSKYKEANTRPTVILLPGLIGSSGESYILHFAEHTQRLGLRCVVFNNRGNGGAELKTSRTYCAANSEDLREVVCHIQTLWPEAPIAAAGVSLGGIILGNYLSLCGTAGVPSGLGAAFAVIILGNYLSHCGTAGVPSGLRAAFAVSMAWDMFESARSLEQPFNHAIFNSFLCKGLKANIEKYKHFFEDYDLQHLMKSECIRDFDDRFIARQFGYASWREYYTAASITGARLQTVTTPFLALNAADDPFAPEKSLPLKDAEDSSHVAILVTKHGGHIGFLEGLFPRHAGYVDRVFAQYMNIVFQHGAELCSVLRKETPEQLD